MRWRKRSLGIDEAVRNVHGMSVIEQGSSGSNSSQAKPSLQSCLVGPNRINIPQQVTAKNVVAKLFSLDLELLQLACGQ